MVRLGFGLLSAALFGVALSAPWPNTTIPQNQDRIIPDSWILTFKKGVPQSELHAFKNAFRKRAETGNMEIHHEYDLGPGMFKGYLLNGPAEAVMPLNDSQWVSQIEPNMAYYRPWKPDVDDDEDDVEDDDEPALMSSSVDDEAPTLRRRTNIRPLRKKDNLWNLEQISGGHHLQYYCPDGCGEGAFIYFIDDGIDHDHPEFAGRIVTEKHFHPGVITPPDRKYDGTQGSFVAGIAAGATRGVAPNAKIIMLNVFGQDAIVRLDFFLMAMEWAVNDIKSRNRIGKAIINLSHWGGPAKEGEAAMRAVADAVRAGIFVTAAAGDNMPDAGSNWPESEDLACVVAATNWKPGYWEHSATGPAVDIAAPGVDVRSVDVKGHRAHQGDYMRRSSTYGAAPHVAGVAATLVSAAKGSLKDLTHMCDLLRCWAIDPGDNWPVNTPRRRLLNMRTADLDDGTPEAEMLKRPECQKLMAMNSTLVGPGMHLAGSFGRF